MGVGKTATSKLLCDLLPKSAFLDGDWCWTYRKDIVNDETKKMVIDNICHILSNYIKCSAYQNIVLCWVIPDEKIFDDILTPLSHLQFNLHKFSLICSEESLINRLQKDIDNNIRSQDILQTSKQRLALYKNMNTQKIDVSDISAQEAAEMIKNKIKGD